MRNYAPNVLLNDNLKLAHIAKGVTNTCISVHGVGCPKGHLYVMAVATHKPVLVEKTDSAVLENSGSSIGQSATPYNLLLGYRGEKMETNHKLNTVMCII